MCSGNSNFYQFPIASSDYQTLLYCAAITTNDLTTKKIETPQQLLQQNVNFDLTKNNVNSTISLNNTSISSLVESNCNNYITNNSIEGFYYNNMPLQAMSNLSNLSPSFAHSQNYIIPNSYNYRSNQYHQSFLHSNAFNYYWPPSNTNVYDGLSRIDANEMSIRSESITPFLLTKSISNHECFQEQKKLFPASINNDWNTTTSISIENLNKNSMICFNEHNALSTNLLEDNYLTYKVLTNRIEFKLKFILF